MSGPSSLRFAPGQFYGGARLSYASHGIIVTHRVADRGPDEVLTHTHGDAHFVLISGGDYVSVAEGRPAEGFPALIYNPPGTTHRDHFAHGRGSYFAISLEPAKAQKIGREVALPDGPKYLGEMAQFALAMRVARCCAVEQGGLTLDALCHELLGGMDKLAQRADTKPPSWLAGPIAPRAASRAVPRHGLWGVGCVEQLPKPMLQQSTALPKAPSCATRTIETDRCKSNEVHAILSRDRQNDSWQ